MAWSLFLLLVIGLASLTFPVQAASPVFRTDFEAATKQDTNRLNMGISNWFEFGGTGGAAMWLEGSERQTSEFACHSGNRCVGMEVTDISKSRRAEFNIMQLGNLGIADEYSVSVWFYLPADWRLHTSSNWYELVNPTGTGGPTYWPYSAVHISQPDISKDIFSLDLDARGTDSVLRNYAHASNFALPRGRWFNLQWYVFLHPTNGIVKVWIDGNLALDGQNVPTKNPSESSKMIVAKVYYDTSDKFSPYRIWVDDLEIYNTLETTEVLASTGTTTVTAYTTSTVTGYATKTVMRYTGTSTSTSTIVVPATVTVGPSVVTTTVETTEALTSTDTTTVTGYTTITVTSYTGTSTSTSTIVVPTTVTAGQLAVSETIQATQTVTSTDTATVTGYTTATVTSYTSTSTSTSTAVVYATVTESGVGLAASIPLTYLGFLSLFALTVGRRATAEKDGGVPGLSSWTSERRCSSN